MIRFRLGCCMTLRSGAQSQFLCEVTNNFEDHAIAFCPIRAGQPNNGSTSNQVKYLMPVAD